MEAGTLNCPNCGAASSTAALVCRFCESRLATVSCPSCFGMMFLGSKHCPHCGAAAARVSDADATPLKCPRCALDMTPIAVGSTSLRECAKCSGLWVDVSALEKICAEREQQAAVLGTASIAAHHPVTNTGSLKIRYIPCPLCDQLMNRINFARCSGVVVDICKGHGTWFDADELRQIIEFIRAGGLEGARAREKHEIEEERRKLRTEQFAAAHYVKPFGKILDLDEERASGVSATAALLNLLRD
ncbi:MAG: zf-TFIIB domain-containing protein [Pyrinomonadaceae bacterium]